MHLRLSFLAPSTKFEAGGAQQYDALGQEKFLPMKNIELANVVSSKDEGENVKEDVASSDDRPTNDIQNNRLQHTESCMMLSTSTKPPFAFRSTKEVQELDGDKRGDDERRCGHDPILEDI
jgi:hypothetical protein